MADPITDAELHYFRNRYKHGVYRRRVPLEMMLKAVARIDAHDAEIRRMDGIRRNLLTRIAQLEPAKKRYALTPREIADVEDAFGMSWEEIMTSAYPPKPLKETPR